MSDARECVILGHEVEIYVLGEDQWRLVVDGEESLVRFADPYAAWAAGVAESYRRGKLLGSPPLFD